MYIGLSGGIGAGKSTVAKMLEQLGARIIDADVIAREVITPGTAGFNEVVAKFGNSILDEAEAIDRKKLAVKVFGDPEALRALEEIVHPRVISRVAELRAQAGDAEVVVYDTPLLVEKHMETQFDAVIIVAAEREVRLDRLLDRGLSRSDIEQRMANQATDAQRNEVADYLISNDGTIAATKVQVEKAWNDITS